MPDGIHHEFRGHVVLVVDDDPGVRWYAEAILQTANLQVLLACDGVEALEIFRKWRGIIGLVITDIRMPRMTGTDLAASLRSECPTLPLMFISGESAPVDCDDPTKGSLFIEKPFRPRTLLDAASQLLQLDATRIHSATFIGA